VVVTGLSALSYSAGRNFEQLAQAQNHAQTVAHGISGLLILTHEYALHGEARAAYQWHKSLGHLLEMLGEQQSADPATIEQVRSLDELFSQLESSKGNEKLRKQRAETLLGQLLSNTQSLSDQYHESSLKLATLAAASEQTLRYTGFVIPVISLVTLISIFALLMIRVLRPLETMRKAVDAVAQGDVSVRSHTGTRDEFGELSLAFDTMALDLVSQLKQEITERQQIENNLQVLVDERTASLKAVVDTAADGIITIDAFGTILSANLATERLFGYSADELVGRNVSILMPQPYQDAHDSYLSKYHATGQSKIIGKGREEEGLHKDGHQFPIYLAVSKVTLANEIRYTGIVRDITRQKTTEGALIAARDEAVRANRAKSEFLSSMSHELRTPMNAILGFGQLMHYDETLSDQHKDNVGEILNAGKHLLELINEVLDLARIEAGRIDLTIEPVAVCSVVEECLHLIDNLAHKRNIKISHHGLQYAVVRADRTRLKQALLNLLSNAVKYNREGGTVHLDVKQQGADRLRILVTDTGSGIAAHRLPEMFQPFNRLGAEGSNIEGTGIGLTITRRIVEMMSGAVGVDSEIGAGSTFWLELPLESLHEPALQRPATVSATTQRSDTAQQHTVLYIEDNPANLRLVEQIIGQRKNIRLLTAHTPQFGIELAQAYHPDLILLDINMPDMDGYQVLAILKADASLAPIPVVAVTSNAMEHDIERGLAAGFSEYITKPLNVFYFLAMLDDQLDPGNKDNGFL
jgi:PAS domain S-box-containing protein